MNRLHAIWLPDCAVISFWAENITSIAAEARPRLGHRTPVHPNAFCFRELKNLLPYELEPFEEEHVVRLPTTTRNVPVPSSNEPRQRNLTAWSLPTADVLGEAFFEHVFEDSFRSRTEPVEFATDLSYWIELSHFGRLLYESGHYVPGCVQLEGKNYSSWKSVISQESRDIWKRFTDSLPPIVQHMADPHTPHHHKEELILSFLDACIDTLARNHGMRHNPVQLIANKPLMPLHRQWLNSLKHGRFHPLLGKGTSVQTFAMESAEWVRGLRPNAYAPSWRLEFDLHVAAIEDSPWHLQFVLANVMQPEHRVPCEELWDNEQVSHLVPRGRDVLFSGLGKAMDAIPKLKNALSGGVPTGLDFSVSEAADFMQNGANQLRRLGFHVTLPSCWEEAESGVKLRVKILNTTSAVTDRTFFLSLNDLVDYKWEVTLGERPLSEEEFRQLSDEKLKLINRDGTWYRIDVDKLEQTIGFMDDQGTERQGSIGDILALSGKLDKQGGIPIHEIVMDAQIQDLNSTSAGMEFELLSQPDLFKGHLPPYQVQGFSWMTFMKSLSLGACLADDMGLGKTIQMIAALLQERTSEQIPGTSLIVCPMSVVGNWVHELERFAPHLNVMVHHGNDRLGLTEFTAEAAKNDVVISTYNLILRDKRTFRGIEWENVILDEAQNIKNSGTKQSKAIRSLNSRTRFCLTGTPIENRLTELWSIMDFLNPGFLGSIGSFRRNFSQPIERDNDANRAAILQRLIRPFVLRRLKSDKEIIRDLPEKTEMKVFCNLSAEQASLYQAIVDDMMERINQSHGIERKGLVLATLTKLKQISNHPAHFLGDASSFSTERSGKLQRLEEMLEVVLESGDRALIFTQYSKLGTLLREKLQKRFGVEVLYMHGGSSKNQRDEMVSRFQRPNGPPLFLLSLKAGGVGLNLTAANHVFHFDRWWNPAIEDQATDRTYRIGQSKNVQVHKFICVGTVEEKIDAMIEEKKRLADNIVTAGESFLTELTAEELLSVFALSRDTIIE